MKRGEFLDTFKGQFSEYKRRYFRRLSFELHGKPFSKRAKGLNTSSKRKIAEGIIDKMKCRKRCMFQSEVACRISIFAGYKTLPQMYNLAKNYIDLFNRKWVAENFHLFTKFDLRRLPYGDDNQISYLSLEHYSIGSTIYFWVSSFSDFLSDICFAYQIKSGEYRDEIGSFSNNYIDLDDDFKGRENCEIYKKLLKNRNRYIAEKGEKEFNNMLKWNARWCQDYLLKNRKLAISDLFYMIAHKKRYDKYRLRKYRETFKNFGHRLPIYDLYEGMAKGWIERMAKSPLTIMLPDIPERDSGKNWFKKEITKRLKKFQKDYPILSHHHIPVGVQIIHKPFRKQKDLDNLIQTILPIFQDVMQPIYSISTKEKGLLRTTVTYRNSVPFCEALRLPPGKKSESFLILKLFSGFLTKHASLWAEADEIIEKAEDEYKWA